MEIEHWYPDECHGQPAEDIDDGVLLGKDGGRADERRPAEGQHFEPRAVFRQCAAREGDGHAGRALAVDGGADVYRGVGFPDELHQGHGDVAAAHFFRRGADVEAVGQHHIEDEAEGHAREHHQTELIIAGGVEPPEQRRDARQQEEPAAVGKDEPLVEGDEIVQRAVDDIVRVGDGEVQPEEPDEVEHPVQLIPQVGPCARKRSFHGDLLVFYHTMIHFTTLVRLAQIHLLL